MGFGEEHWCDDCLLPLFPAETYHTIATLHPIGTAGSKVNKVAPKIFSICPAPTLAVKKGVLTGERSVLKPKCVIFRLSLPTGGVAV